MADDIKIDATEDDGAVTTEEPSDTEESGEAEKPAEEETSEEEK